MNEPRVIADLDRPKDSRRRSDALEAKLERQRQRKAGEIEADTHNLGVHAERWGRSTLR